MLLVNDNVHLHYSIFYAKIFRLHLPRIVSLIIVYRKCKTNLYQTSSQELSKFLRFYIKKETNPIKDKSNEHTLYL